MTGTATTRRAAGREAESRPRVFVCRDDRLDRPLEDLSLRLGADGVDVVRGPNTAEGTTTRFPQERWNDWFRGIDAAVFSNLNPCTRSILEHSPRLRGVVMPTIGTEAVDVEAATDLGIVVAHGACPENYESMAEATIMLMLMLLYQPMSSADVLAGRRSRPPFDQDQLWARMLTRKTVGLVGFGRIAQAVARRLGAWSVSLLACSPSLPLTPAHARSDVTAVSLDELLDRSDVVCLLASGGERTRHLIGEREIGRMKSTSLLVNAARGTLVDEAALSRALACRRIAGAALDVFEREPLPLNSPLRDLPNVILTPHLVGHTRELAAGISATLLANVRNILQSVPPECCRNPAVLPRWARRFPSALRVAPRQTTTSDHDNA